jgi:hypothetical protein
LAERAMAANEDARNRLRLRAHGASDGRRPLWLPSRATNWLPRAPPLCVCDEDGHCRWQFVDCE